MILNRRQQFFYAAARSHRSERWSSPIRDWRRPDAVLLNPRRTAKDKGEDTKKGSLIFATFSLTTTASPAHAPRQAGAQARQAPASPH